jgi:hypothetical protein
MKRRAQYVSYYDIMNITIIMRQQVSGGALS